MPCGVGVCARTSARGSAAGAWMRVTAPLRTNASSRASPPTTPALRAHAQAPPRDTLLTRRSTSSSREAYSLPSEAAHWVNDGAAKAVAAVATRTDFILLQSGAGRAESRGGWMVRTGTRERERRSDITLVSRVAWAARGRARASIKWMIIVACSRRCAAARCRAAPSQACASGTRGDRRVAPPLAAPPASRPVNRAPCGRAVRLVRASHARCAHAAAARV